MPSLDHISSHLASIDIKNAIPKYEFKGNQSAEDTDASVDYNGILQFEKSQGRTETIRSYGKYPVKFLQPSGLIQDKKDAVAMYILGYGGGLVSGDVVHIKCDIGDDCRVVFCTQSSTKIFKAIEEKTCYQNFTARLSNDSTLAHLPDPVTCFAKSRYSQTQTIHLTSCSNLIFVDWMTSGRKRGLRYTETGISGVEMKEEWEFHLYESFNQVLVDGKLIFADRVLLKDDEQVNLKARMSGLHVFGMIFVYGAQLERILLLHQEQGRRKRSHKDYKVTTNATDDRLLFSVSAIGSCASILRFASDQTETAYTFLREMLWPLKDILGYEPYRKGR